MAGEVIPDFGGMTQAAYNPVHVGQVDAFVAPDGTAYNAGFGAANKYLYLGRTVPDSLSSDITPNFLNIVTGTPETMKESYLIGLNGKVGFGLMEPSALAYSLGAIADNRLPMYRLTTPVSTTNAATSTFNKVKLTSATGFALNDEVAIEVTAGNFEYTKIVGLNGVDMDVYPFLSAAPTVGLTVKLIDGWDIALGGSKVKRYSLLLIHNDADHGRQIVTHFKSMRSGGFKDEMPTNKEVKIPLEFEAFGHSRAGVNGPVIATRYILKHSSLKLNPQVYTP